ncbi:hypothetical protein HMPREF2858_05555 [Neisseria sp. HMSC073B07]|nr:hypothetical protein HMPREF2858_05555 [Neisseria sp. HMSC073B07]
MNRYDRYKDSGIPWLGEVPEHWEIKHSNQIFKIHNGATPKTSEPDYWGDEIAWFTPKDLGDNKNKEIAASLKMITKEGYENCGVSLAPAKSIALSKRAPIGHLAITLLPAVVNQGCFLLEVLSPNDVNYLYYWLYANKSTLNSFGQGSTFMELPREKFAMLKISIPSEKEQTAIAHYLDTKLGEIDALIDKQQTLLEKLAEQRTAVITHAVTKGLNPTAPMKNSGVEWLGDVPAHWEVKRLKFSVRNISQKVESQTSDLRYFGLENIESFTGRLILNIELESEGIANKFQENDVLFGKLRPYLAKVHLATQNGLVSTETLVFRAKKAINPKFLFYFCVSKDFIDAVNGTTFGSKMPRANWEDIGNFKMLIPSLEEQAIIIDYLNQETAKIDRLCETVNQTIGRLKEYRTALITQAVTGKIKVTDE